MSRTRKSKGGTETLPALGLDLDGTIDEAPEFFRFLAKTWPGPVYIITYRDNQEKAIADAAKFGVEAEVILVSDFSEKAQIIKDRNIKVFFDDMGEVLIHVPEDVAVFKVRNGGNFCFDTKKWYTAESRCGRFNEQQWPKAAPGQEC